MNLKPLVKYFPELSELEPDAQLAVLQCAYDRCFGPERKLHVWRTNLLSSLLLTSMALLLILVIGPALKLATSTTALVVMLVLLPGFFFWQQHQHINRLRPAVTECLRKR